jgi:hypothetical protein
MRIWLLAIAGCVSSVPPAGEFQLDAVNGGCVKFDSKTIVFDGTSVEVGKQATLTTQLFAGTDVQINGDHVTFSLTYSVHVSDTPTFETGHEDWAVDVSDDHLSATSNGTYNGKYGAQPPYACTALLTWNGER